MKRRRWWRWGVEIAVVVGLVLGVRAWQARGAATRPAPALAGERLDGAPFDLSAAARTDGPVLVHFWATWCGVCTAEAGTIDALADGRPVITVASRSGPADRVRAHLAGRGHDYPVLLDGRGALAHRWGVTAFPTTFVVGRDGRIGSVDVGFATGFWLRTRLFWAGLS